MGIPKLEEVGIGYILENYLPQFPNETRDAIVAAVMRSKVIRDAFDNPGGKQILMGVVNRINSNIIKLIDACDKPDGVDIKELAKDISISRHMLLEWASIYATGAMHINEAAKVKSRKK
jgi:hypothetical protein